jgi:hypothetical protein
MKTIKAITDFGIVDVTTIGTKKEIFGELWIVAKCPVLFMNAKEPLIIRMVLHYKTGANLPIKGIKYNAPAKDYLTYAERFLKGIPFDAIRNEIAKYKTINQ